MIPWVWDIGEGGLKIDIANEMSLIIELREDLRAGALVAGRFIEP